MADTSSGGGGGDVDPDAAEETRTAAEAAAVVLFASLLLTGPPDGDVPAVSPADMRVVDRVALNMAERIARLALSTVAAPLGWRGDPWRPEVMAREVAAEVAPAVAAGLYDEVTAIRRALADQPPRDPGELSLPREAARRFATLLYARLVEAMAPVMPRPGWLSSNVVLRKTWVTRGDSRVRPLHRRLHGKTRRFGQDFFRWPYMGARLRYPGDPEAPLEATANCRCVLWLSWGDPQSTPDLDLD